MLRSLAEADKAVFPRIIPVACKFPATLTFPLERVIRSESLECPIIEPSIVTLPAVNEPAETAPDVDIVSSPTSIDPNPDVI